MNKAERQQVFDKYGGKCAYCGCDLPKVWHVDHIQAHWHNMSQSGADRVGIVKGGHKIENLNPACPRCNRWKGTFGIDDFRNEIQQQLARLKSYSANYRMALDYGMLQENPAPVTFYFERVAKSVLRDLLQS